MLMLCNFDMTNKNVKEKLQIKKQNIEYKLYFKSIFCFIFFNF